MIDVENNFPPPKRQHVLLSCLPKGASELSDLIRQRGGIPVLIGQDAMVELSGEDIAINWSFADALPPKRLTELTLRLGQDLEDDSDPLSLAEQAAAFLFLALRHSHGDCKRALAGWHISWDGQTAQEKVEYLT
jgi:hypothetical protein